MKKLLTTTINILFLTLPTIASSSSAGHQDNWYSPNRMYVGTYGGYGNVSGAYRNDGQTVQGRLVFGLNATEKNLATLGAEVGVESGNDMRLEANPTLVQLAGGLQLQATLKPLADLLITLKYPLSNSFPIIGIVKGGLAYRQLQINNRESSRDALRKINPELQLGLGVHVTNNAILTAFYQGIYSGSSVGATLTTNDEVTINRIPTQQAVFFGLEYSFGATPMATPVEIRSSAYMDTPPANYYHSKTVNTAAKKITVKHLSANKRMVASKKLKAAAHSRKPSGKHAVKLSKIKKGFIS